MNSQPYMYLDAVCHLDWFNRQR